MLTIIASLEYELAGLRRELQSFRSGNGSGKATDALRARNYCKPETHVIGVGRSQSQRRVNDLLTEYRHTPDMGAEEPRELLLLGFAGAVEPGFQTGDLVLSQRYYRADERRNPPNPPLEKGGKVGFSAEESTFSDTFAAGEYVEADPAMSQRALEAAAEMCLPHIKISERDSLTVNGLVATPEGKMELGRRYPVGVVAMEDYWVAASARDAGVPFLSARVVLDPVNQGLPGYLVGLAQARSLAVLSAVAMPWRIPTLLGLRGQMRLAQQVLTQFALSYISQLSAGNRPIVVPKLANAAVRQGYRQGVHE